MTNMMKKSQRRFNRKNSSDESDIPASQAVQQEDRSDESYFPASQVVQQEVTSDKSDESVQLFSDQSDKSDEKS